MSTHFSVDVETRLQPCPSFPDASCPRSSAAFPWVRRSSSAMDGARDRFPKLPSSHDNLGPSTRDVWSVAPSGEYQWKLPIEVNPCGNQHLRPFCFRDLDLYPITFIYELDSYPLKIYRKCENELPTSGLSKIIVWHTYRHERNYIPRRFAGGQKYGQLIRSHFCVRISKLLNTRIVCVRARRFRWTTASIVLNRRACFIII